METTAERSSKDHLLLKAWVHDLRNPVCKILFASSFVSKEDAQGDCSNKAEYTSIINESCNEIMGLIESLMKNGQHQ